MNSSVLLRNTIKPQCFKTNNIFTTGPYNLCDGNVDMFIKLYNACLKSINSEYNEITTKPKSLKLNIFCLVCFNVSIDGSTNN